MNNKNYDFFYSSWLEYTEMVLQEKKYEDVRLIIYK